jgi:hypothetical protein
MWRKTQDKLRRRTALLGRTERMPCPLITVVKRCSLTTSDDPDPACLAVLSVDLVIRYSLIQLVLLGHCDYSIRRIEAELSPNTSEDPAGEAGGLVWDEFHRDPRAEVVLVSKDNIGFRVPAWSLAQSRCVTLRSAARISN